MRIYCLLVMSLLSTLAQGAESSLARFCFGGRLTWLYCAAYHGQVAWVDLLLRLGAPVNRGTITSLTPLHAAVGRGHHAVARLLLERGAGVDKKEIGGCSALAFAALRNDLFLIKLLFDYGASGKEVGPLHVAARDDSGDAARLLLAHGAQVNAVNERGATPLHCAAYEGHKDMVQLLLLHGACINALFNGRTAAQLAQERGHHAVYELLHEEEEKHKAAENLRGLRRRKHDEAEASRKRHVGYDLRGISSVAMDSL